MELDLFIYLSIAQNFDEVIHIIYQHFSIHGIFFLLNQRGAKNFFLLHKISIYQAIYPEIITFLQFWQINYFC